MSDKGVAHIEYPLCMACGICVQACPFGCLELTKTGIDVLRNAYPELQPESACTGCGLCARACPVDCITIHS